MRVISLVAVANKSGGGLNQGALLRFLGEMQWFPAAGLADYIMWEPVDSQSARATITYGGIAAAMTFTFGADGRLIESAATRYNDARGRNERWVNRNESDGEFGGIRVPVAGEAACQSRARPGGSTNPARTHTSDGVSPRSNTTIEVGSINRELNGRHSFPVARAFGIWLTLVAVESNHGVKRRLLLEPRLGDLRARQLSVFTGAVLIALVFWFTLKWLGPQPARRWWTFGLLWLALTLAFEIGLGRASGMSWERIVSDFDPRRGGLLAFGMLVILVSPRLLAQRRGLIEHGHQA
jgi:hypothetical protein